MDQHEGVCTMETAGTTLFARATLALLLAVSALVLLVAWWPALAVWALESLGR